MVRKMGFAVCLLWLGVQPLQGAPAEGISPQARGRASDLISTTGVDAGLAVLLSSADGEYAAALHAAGFGIVQGLSGDADAVREARAVVHSLQCYGPVSFDIWTESWLPYADNVVNVLSAGEAGAISRDEILRVLAPRGKAVIVRDGERTILTKPVPAEIDDWTHYRHDASSNAVADDTLVAPPRYLQWEAGPLHGRSHEFTASTSTLVSAAGRIFYIADKGPVGTLKRPASWHIIARDAFNGLLLWERPVERWFSFLCGWTNAPRTLQRRMVAIGDTVFVTLGYYGEIAALDAASGNLIRTYANTVGTEEILWHGGRLILSMRQVSDEQMQQFDKLEAMTTATDATLWERETRRPLFQAFRRGQNRAEPALMALDVESGKQLWKLSGEKLGGLRLESVRASGDAVFYQGKQTVCIDLESGERRWARDTHPLIALDERFLVCSDHKTVTALDANTGETLWTKEPVLSRIHDTFIVGNSLWLGGFKPYDTGRKKYTGPAWGPHFATERDLKTGDVKMHIETESPGHHHRCYDSVATKQYMLVGRRGTEFYDLRTGEVTWNSWARGVCRYGVMPCNGLLYKPPHACGCYVTVKLNSFTALSGQRSALPASTPDKRFEKGPAFADVTTESEVAEERNSWPTFRGNPARSAFTTQQITTTLQQQWSTTAGTTLTAPVVAHGHVYVADKEHHQLLALDQETGKTTWSFTAGARIDSPPTVFGNAVFFGCRDGFVYKLRATDGELVWRFRASEDPRRIVSHGQLECVSPLHGSVLIADGVLTITAGRSSFLDEGIDLLRLDPNSGRMLSRTTIAGPTPDTGKAATQYGPNAMPGARWDILSTDEEHVYLQDHVFDKNGATLSTERPHLFALTGYLDDSWTHRSYWIFGAKPSIATGCSGRSRTLIYGRLLAFDQTTVYGYGRESVHWSNEFLDGQYRLYARPRTEDKPLWSVPTALDVKAMIVADAAVFAAGSEAIAPGRNDPVSAASGATLQVFSVKDGSILSRSPLAAPPVFNGMAAAYRKLYLTLVDGSVICFGAAER